MDKDSFKNDEQMDDDKEVFIDTEEIGNFLYNKLILHGIVPSEKEIDILSEAFFDYLLFKGFIVEEE